ncbi:MAG: NAD-dependent epimerase/dehydratase family protein [Planctomycetota bacterium]|nr:NAD-dependent epimerase/dehydratase family protein [Planctomycetota bacterium]MEC8161356.1 NAD-dependent epimerase/dehydratase family protein [Planctomycetota bacterium]MEC8304813.1 NAD-dependent epimerase/dehydratase family protein [Planctomycetota bacterium]MEC8390666.1 NAD-dependent epimerase/dehydratase family protein [Planctomycetota bacterium]MEC9117783.1 NAD-dependent epimerase/dehydratase family protein [Planctomycetota bacterium]
MGTVLVTGAAGFIANRVARDLAAEHKVVAIDNVNDYYDVRLKEHRIEALDGIEFHRIDIENKAAMQPLFEENQFDAVVNLAARAGVRYSMENPHVYMTTNAHGSLNLLELMREFDVKKYVLASTSSLYAGQQMPFVESLAVNTPISPYAASKKAAEVMAYSYHFLFGIDVSVVRYFTVYGPAGRPDMSIFRFIQWIDQGVPIELFGDGSQSRDFTYVDDIASGTIAALKPVGYEIINLGGGNQPISMNTVIATLEDLLGKKAKINYRDFHKADLKSTWADISKAKNLLGWEPKISLQEGLENSVKWYVDHQPWSSSLDLGTA